MPTKRSDAELLVAATKLAGENGMYVVHRMETRNRQEVLMYLLFRRLTYGYHGTLIGKRNSAAGLFKLVTKAKEVK